MPEPITSDVKDKVKAVALQIGVKEAAREMGISEGTVKAWSAREGWMKEKAEYEKLREEKRLAQPGATRSISDVVLKYGDKTKLRLSKATYKTSNALSKLPEESLLCNTQALVNTVNAAAKLHNWQTPTNQALVNINLTGVRYEEGK